MKAVYTDQRKLAALERGESYIERTSPPSARAAWPSCFTPRAVTPELAAVQVVVIAVGNDLGR